MKKILSALRVNTIIIGAGPCGLGAAYRLNEKGDNDFLVLERNNYVGGLATSFKDDNGFTWDVGGHVVHSHYDYFDKVFALALKDNILTHNREAWVWLYDTFVPYPFQNNLRYLPKKIQDECLDGIKNISKRKNNLLTVNDSNDFKSWITTNFGKGIADHFLFPYNSKIWAHPLEKMGSNWTGDRVSPANYEKALKSITEQKDNTSWGPNNVFNFPNKGGSGAIWNSIYKMIPQDNFRLNTSLSSLNTDKKIATTQDGVKYKYNNIISTIPITTLLNISRNNNAKKLNTNLLHSSVHITGLGIKGQVPDHLKTKSWMYFPENNTPFFRATVFSNYSPNNVPDHQNQWSLMLEVSESQYKPLSKTSVIQGALNTSLITSSDKIISIWNHTASHGYPIPTLNRDEIIDPIVKNLEEKQVYSRGRFGAWKYEVSNQDHTFMQGVEVVDKILEGKKEITLWNPNEVNGS